MANHSSRTWEWNGEKFTVGPGQMVTSLESIALKSGKGVTTKMVRSALKRFEKLGFLTDQSSKRGRLITIVSWRLYQHSYSEQGKENGSSRAVIGQTNGNVWSANKNEAMKKVENKKITLKQGDNFNDKFDSYFD